uniref:Uncharacterized protein n=1 Tax=Magallana gigas TaxID=29159 RepID=K1QSX3_MAGGI
MSAMTHCQWAAGYHGNRTSEHSRPDHVVTFHGTFQLKPMCCPHSQSQCNSFCVCLSADQGRKKNRLTSGLLKFHLELLNFEQNYEDP